MEAKIIDNISRIMATELSSAIASYQDVRIAVAFMSKGGLDIVQPSIEKNVEEGGQIEFLLGLDMNVTEPDAIQALYNLSCENTNISVYCHTSLDQGAIYHPKLYLFKTNNEASLIVGSSNLTHRGLKTNIEVNVSILANVQDGVIIDAYDSYQSLKFHRHRIIPDQEFIDLYIQIFQDSNRQKRRGKRDRISLELAELYKQKVSVMQRPTPTSRDLVGWLEIVYDILPDGKFSNKDIYAYESIFRQKYPGNQNIRAKIRQQLQSLRDLGFIEHLSRGTWRKL